MRTPAWYVGLTPNFTVNKYMWVNTYEENYDGTITLFYSERVNRSGKYEIFNYNKETCIAGQESIRLCNAEEMADIHKLSGAPVINNHYSII